jgi:hypothetical protein
MKDFIKNKLHEAITAPSFDLPNNIQPTPEELNKLKSLTWRDISVEPRENDGSPMFYIDVAFRDPELNNLTKSIVFSIQMIKDMYYHPHLFLADKIQGVGIAPKLLKVFIMDFGHIYVSKARTLNPNFTKMVQGLTNDPDFESFGDSRATLVIKKGNPDRDGLIKIINPNG